MRLLTQAQYARRRGVHRSRITQLVKEGRLILTKGKIDPTVADANWNQNIDPVKRDNLKTVSKPKQQKKSGSRNSSEPSYIQVKTEHELLKKQLTDIELQIKQDNLISKDKSIEWLTLLVSNARAAFWGLPKRLAEPLALISDSKEIEFEMRKEIRRILEELARPLSKEQKAEAFKND